MVAQLAIMLCSDIHPIDEVDLKVNDLRYYMIIHFLHSKICLIGFEKTIRAEIFLQTTSNIK
jgi:hypothetical protein